MIVDLLVLPGRSKASVSASRDQAFTFIPYLESVKFYHDAPETLHSNNPHWVLAQEDMIPVALSYLSKPHALKRGGIFFTSSPERVIKAAGNVARGKMLIPLLTFVPLSTSKKLVQKQAGPFTIHIVPLAGKTATGEDLTRYLETAGLH